MVVFNQNIAKYLKVADDNDECFLLDLNFEMHPLIDFPDFCFCNTYFRAKRKTIRAFKEKEIWTIDLSSIESQNSNEKDGELMSFENLLFVPLRGGQLLALDAETGAKVWVQDYNGRSGFYTNFGEKIYKHDGLSLIEIDANTGKTLQKKIFAESELEIKQFYALNYLWVYEDAIILFGLNKEIVMLDRLNFKLLEYVVLPSTISTSKDNIIWHDKKLYVLDMTNTLHIYEKE